MLLLTMTPAIVVAIQYLHQVKGSTVPLEDEPQENEPDLEDPRVGNPISHGQIIDLSKRLRHTSSGLHDDASATPSFHLADLLRGSQVYIPPRKPKPEPVSLALFAARHH